MVNYQLQQRDFLLEISRAMTSKLDLPSLLRLILKSTAEMLGAQVALIAVQESSGEFRVRASYGVPAGQLKLFTPLLENIPILRGQSHSRWQIPDLPVRLRLVSRAAGIPLRQVVALPMLVEERLVGVIYVFRMTELGFSTNDRQILASFADQAAIAIHNARLYQQSLAEKSRLDAIIEHSADGVMILDSECKVVVFNRALSLMTGWRAADAIGQPCATVLHMKDARGNSVCGTHCPQIDAFAGVTDPHEGEESTTHYVEGDIERPDGSRISVGVTHSLLYDEEGHVLNVIVNVHDITRFREAEELQSTFISVISHELKTPVALIKGYAGTLRREDASWDKETVRDGLEIIEEESDRLDGLIDNLLDASRIEAGALKLELTDLLLSDLARDSVEKFRTQSNVHEFKLDFSPDLPLVYADEERMRQVFYNLLSNAIKYSPRGGAIQVGGRAVNGDVMVYISDEGVGIPLDEQERLFRRFYRVDSGLRRKTQGAGLGLYLSRAIIEAQGGRIWVESQAGQGATFYFTLPILR